MKSNLNNKAPNVIHWIFFFIFLAGSTSAWGQTIRYVKPASSGSGDGSSWANASSGLQSMINASASGDQVWVAAGSYYPTSGTDRNISFSMKNGVAIYGGFVGTETLLAERDWAANETILSGDIGTTGVLTDNSYRIIYNSGLNSSAVLDGVTIRDAYNPNSSNGNQGAGIRNDNASPTFINCIIRNNFTNSNGGGVANDNGSPAFTNCLFIGNSAGAAGGAFRTEYGAPYLNNCSFTANSAYRGGAIAGNFSGTNHIAINCIFWGNTGTDGYNNIYNNQLSETTITYSIVEEGYPGLGNLNNDPLFVDPINSNYHLQPCSPAINNGDNASVPSGITTDLDGNPRFYNSGTVDMGAYEYQGEKNVNPTDGGEIAADQTICYGDTPDQFTSVSPAASDFVGDLEYQWQLSTASPTFVDISGAVSETYSHPGTVTQTTWFRRLAKVTCESEWVESNVVQVTVNPTRLYVTESGAGLMNGSSWANAFSGSQLQTAINAQCVTEVWVATGTYKPTSGTDRNISFSMKNGVAIYGGFVGTETLLSERDWVANETILSGDIGTTGNNSDNSYTVVTGSGTDATAVIDGFTITGGNSNGGATFPEPDYTGGGMYNNSGSPTVANCIFSGNTANGYGGGMFNLWGSSPTVTNCTFSGNAANLGGGGMFNFDVSSPVVTNCTFSGNESNRGSGMYNNNSSPSLTNCSFSGNPAFVGGGMYNISSSPSLTNCGFSGNSAFNGGGMYNQGSSPTLTNCSFFGNGADLGGGMSNGDGSSPTVTNCSFFGNTASGEFGKGGGMYNFGFPSSSPIVSNCILWGNSSGIENDGGNPSVSYSIVQGGYAGTGNLNVDPLFVNAGGGNLRLQACSPAINAGSNTAVPVGIITDLDGNPRFYDNGIVDMGAYEYQGEKTTNPTDGGEIAADQTICSGDVPAAFTSVSPASGFMGELEYQWQISTATPTFTDILGAISETYTHVGTVTQTTWFRRLAKVDCETVWVESNVVEISVYNEFTPGAIATTGQTICYNTAATVEIGSITAASGGDGNNIYSWKSSTDGFTTSSTVVGAVSPTFTPVGALTQTTSYRRYAKDGICNTTPEEAMGTWTVTVRDDFTPGAIENTGETICYNTEANVEIGSTTAASGGDGSIIYSWKSSTDGFTTSSTVVGAVSPTFTPVGALTQTTSYRRYAKDGTCNTEFEVSTGTWEVTVQEELTIDCPEDIEQTNDLGECSASVTFAATANGTPTPILTYKLDETSITSPHVFEVGTHTVFASATNDCGVVSCSFTVTVNDTEKPTVLCKNITVNLDDTGNAVITPNDINNGSTDNCGIATMTLSRTEFSCADMGSAIPVTLSATDVNGNTASCTATVTVNELSVPATRVNITAASAPNGQVKFTATPVNGGDNPTYQWYKNGEKIDGETGSVLISTCKSGDVHHVVMQSSLPCTVPATSNAMCTY